MLQRIRNRVQSEEGGFTLIELLVVILIIGILAAIAIPAFLNQRQKSQDSAAKSLARSAQTAMETCATENAGKYTGCDKTKLAGIEPSLDDSKLTTVTPTADGYTITATSDSTKTATIVKASATSAPTRSGSVGSW